MQAATATAPQSPVFAFQFAVNGARSALQNLYDGS
jgi:hypothetical protein